MNKKSHLLVTGIIAEKIPERGKIWFLFGSILPDILFHTYLKGHTWDSSFDNVRRRMYEIEKNGRDNRYSYLMLGYILHYVEDFYTFPHNPAFQDGLASHIRYERELAEYLQEKDDLSFGQTDNMMSLPVALEYLKKSHEEYLEKAGDCENDIRYIIDAAGTVGNCLLRAIQENSRENPVFVVN